MAEPMEDLFKPPMAHQSLPATRILPVISWPGASGEPCYHGSASDVPEAAGRQRGALPAGKRRVPNPSFVTTPPCAEIQAAIDEADKAVPQAEAIERP